MSSKVFLGYSPQDRKHINKALAFLEKRGMVNRGSEEISDTIEHLAEGASFRDGIRATISSANKVVLLWTQAAAESQYVNYEAGMADALGKPMIIVIPDKSAPEVPENLSDAKIVRLGEDG